MNFWLATGLTFFFGATFFISTADAAWYPTYWKTWIQSYNVNEESDLADAVEYNKNYRSPRYYRSSRSGNDAGAQTSTVKRTKTLQAAAPEKYIRATVTPVRASSSVWEIDSTPVRIFTLGFSHHNSAKSTEFIPAVLLNKLDFQIFGNTGISADLENLRLVVEGNDEEFSFDSNGKVTLNLHGARMARGETLSLPIAIKIFDPENTPNIPGTLRVRFTGARAAVETENKDFPVQIVGTPISDQIVFDPTPVSTGTSVFSGGNTKIYGKMLAAGQSAMVLSTTFSAYYDDMLIREITVSDTISNGAVDSFVDKISAIDLRTGKTLATSRFVNGRARFNFSPRLAVARGGSQLPIGFQVTLDEKIRSSVVNTQFRLTIESQDLKVQGVGSGKEVPDANKNFAIDNETFTVVKNVITASVADQPDGFAVGVGPETAFRFFLSGEGRNDVSLGRISFGVFLSGLDFAGGTISPDDFELVRIVGTQQYRESGDFSISGTRVIFDPTKEILISKDSPTKFGLRVATESVGNSNGDAISVNILGDSTRNVDTLAALRSTEKNFIWSDFSGIPHSTNSGDWLSGFQVSGLPTNTTVVRRFGK